jgi:potassium efflux system protein
MRALRSLVFAVIMAAAALAATGLAAQPAPERPTLDAVRLTLDQLEAEGKREGLSDEALADLRDRVLPIRDDLRERLATLEAELAEIEARRQKLGPPPAADAPPEEPGLAAERQKLNQSFAEADAAVKQARLLTARAEDLQNRVTERRRDLFTRQLFERGASILDPYFWMEVSDGLPRELRSLGILARSWWTYAENNGGFVGAIGALLTLLARARPRAMRTVSPRRLRRCGGSCASPPPRHCWCSACSPCSTCTAWCRR